MGRGSITHESVERIHGEIRSRLARHGASLDAIYYCPIVPTEINRSLVDHHDRKPGPGMLLRAARDLELDLATSWMVGDLISDALAGYHVHCRGSILVRSAMSPVCVDSLLCLCLRICEDLLEVIALIAHSLPSRRMA